MQRTCDNCINRDWIKGQSSYLIRTSETCNKRCFKIGKSGVEPTHWELRPTTNADRIRAMSDEELEVFLCGIAATNCCGACMVQEYCYAGHNGFGDWLKQPVKDGEDE